MTRAIAQHRAFVSIPNIPLTPEDMDKNLAWMEKVFTQRGFDFQVLETKTIPLGFAQKMVDEKLPTVLFYRNY